MSILESRVRLVVVGGVHDGRVLPVQPPFLIGRGVECNLRPASDAVSLRHCAIQNRQGRPVILDLGSTNGTFVNGVQLTCDFPLRDGDELRVGPLHLLVRVYDLIRCSEAAIDNSDSTQALDEGVMTAAASEAPSVALPGSARGIEYPTAQSRRRDSEHALTETTENR